MGAAGALPPFEPFGDGVRPVAVEAEAVDEAAFLREPEHPRLRVAGLALGGDGADLREAEPEVRPCGHGIGLLVEPCGEPDRVREAKPPELLCQPRVVDPQAPLQQRAERRCSGEHAQRRHRNRVGALGVEPEEQWPHEGAVGHAPESWSACRASAMSFSVIPPWLWVASVTVTRFHEIARSG